MENKKEINFKIGSKEFKKICKLSTQLLRKRPTIYNLSNPFLFIVSGHPFILSKYKKINYHEVNIIFLFSYILKISFNFLKIKLYLIKLLFTKNFSSIDKNFYNGTLVVSHLINSENFIKSVDTQYGGIEKSNKNIKKIYFYLNHIGFDNKSKINLRNNIFINNDCISLKEYKKITNSLFKEFIYLISKIKRSKNNFEKKFYIECSKYLFSLSTLKNIILYNNLSNIVIQRKIKSVLMTLEGHPFEHLIYLIASKQKIKVFAYQNAYITKSHFSMFLNFVNNSLPTKILSSGIISYNFLRKKFNKKKVILLGSKKFKRKIKINKKNNFNCLVVPTALESEAEELLKICYNCFQINDKINTKFIIRLHPKIDKLNFLKKNKKYLENKNKIQISDSSLIKDISKSKYVLYRASSVVVEALQQGLIPIFYHDEKNYFQSDALWQLKSRLIIKKTSELVDILNHKKFFNKKKIAQNIKFANNFYTPLNNKELKNLF